MDPSALLDSIRSRVGDTLAGEVPDEAAPYALAELAQDVRDLADWLSKGGFKPSAWTR